LITSITGVATGARALPSHALDAEDIVDDRQNSAGGHH
jgi:hypothetical protein